MSKVLVACEFSGRVREAFAVNGHQACSVDLLPTEIPGNHLIADVLSVLDYGWDLMVAFPPCTYICRSGARWHVGTERRTRALAFVVALMNAPIPRICIENPIGAINSEISPPDQIIQPWQFGHGETKATCLWLKNLPTLRSTNVVTGRYGRVHYAAPSSDRWKNRSRTFSGIADAMGGQWS